LVAENEVLREALATIQKELNDIVVQRREMYIKRKKIEMGDEYRDEGEVTENNILQVKKDIFNMPVEPLGQQALDCLKENVRRFREFMKRMDVLAKEFEDDVENESDIDKIKCVKNMRALLSTTSC
jgi:hypothetical protein